MLQSQCHFITNQNSGFRKEMLKGLLQGRFHWDQKNEDLKSHKTPDKGHNLIFRQPKKPIKRAIHEISK